MENLKNLVRFNRYKSVESFNNATDITSSTISIVKLDDNIMDIYLGRTQLTHSNFPEVNIELRNLIDSLNVKLNNIKKEFDSNLSSLDDKHKKELSEYISNFEDGLKNLKNYTNNLSKEVSNIKSDIQNKYNHNEQQIKDIEKSISDINILLSNQNDDINEISNKIGTIGVKQNSTISDIVDIKKDIKALYSEYYHILKKIGYIDTNIENILLKFNDININENSIDNLRKYINELLKKIDDNVSEINNLKASDIKFINGISDIKKDIKALYSEQYHILEDLSNIKKNLSKNDDYNDVENSVDNLRNYINELLKKIDNNISEINNLKASDIKFINDISNLKKNILALQTEDQHIFKILNELISITKTIESDNVNLNDEIISLKEKIRHLTGVNVDNIETLEGANRRLTKLENSDKEFKITIDEIKDNINSIIEKTNGDFLLLENIINANISSLETKIDNLTNSNQDFFNDINGKIKKLEGADEDLKTLIENITGLDSEIFDILYDVDKINKDLIELRNHVDKIKVPTKVSELENDKNYLTEHQDISGKQDTITDLDEIRANAELAKTALQSIPEEYVTNEELNNQGYAKKSDIPKLVWITDSDLDL